MERKKSNGNRLKKNNEHTKNRLTVRPWPII